MNVPEGLRYSKDHEWVRIEGEVATIGITDYAQDALGDVVYVDPPEVGSDLTAGDSFGEVESTKSVSELYAPISGSVASTNPDLESEPEKLNADPAANMNAIQKIVTAAARSFQVVDGYDFKGEPLGYTGKTGTTTTAGKALE